MKPALQLETAYRSRLEKKIADQLQSAGVDFAYEGERITYVVPARNAKYLPDFKIGDIYIEAKGWLKAADRQKMIFVKQCNPSLDIRLVFQNANNKIYKGSPTSYAKWCDDHDFLWSDKGTIPKEWLDEARQQKSGCSRKSK